MLSIGKAAGYVIANRARLTRFLTDPRIPLDNNATERGIRGPVVGRKNHYGSKDTPDRAAGVAGIHVESAHCHAAQGTLPAEPSPGGETH